MNDRQYAEISSLMYTAAGHIQEAIEALEQAADLARSAGAPGYFAGQLDSYTIPSLRGWVTEVANHQPGNLPRLLEQVAADSVEEG